MRLQYRVQIKSKASKTGDPICFLLHYLSFCYDFVQRENSTACKITDAMVLHMLIVCVSGATSGMSGIMFCPI